MVAGSTRQPRRRGIRRAKILCRQLAGHRRVVVSRRMLAPFLTPHSDPAAARQDRRPLREQAVWDAQTSSHGGETTTAIFAATAGGFRCTAGSGSEDPAAPTCEESPWRE